MTRGRFDHDLLQCVAGVLFALFLFAPCAVAEQLSPVTEFTVRHYGAFEGIDSDPFGFFGYVQESPDIVDETFIELDLTSLTAAQNVELELKVLDFRQAFTFDVSTYYGSGSPSLAPFGTGTLLTTLSLGPGTGERTYTIDVTSQVAAALADDQAFLGFRLHDPAGRPPGSDTYPFVQYESALLLYSVPEPSTFVLAGVALVGLLAHVWRKRRI